MDWIFSGIGTFFIGLLIGGGSGSYVGHKIAIRSFRQNQKAGDHATQNMVGGDSKNNHA